MVRTNPNTVVFPQLYNTVCEFVSRYGVDKFRLLLDVTKTHAQIASELGVCASAVTRMIGKFCDVHVVLKPDVLEFLESHFNIQADALNNERGLIDSQKRELQFIKGGNRGKLPETGENEDT